MAPIKLLLGDIIKKYHLFLNNRVECAIKSATAINPTIPTRLPMTEAMKGSKSCVRNQY
jgi:hypothetical protein